jgi:hypothetical protein
MRSARKPMKCAPPVRRKHCGHTCAQGRRQGREITSTKLQRSSETSERRDDDECDQASYDGGLTTTIGCQATERVIHNLDGLSCE